MSTEALSQALFFEEPSRFQNNYFLGTLKRAKYGRLRLTLPDGSQMILGGRTLTPSANWWIFDWGVLRDFMLRGTTGFADSYCEGRWDSENIEELVAFGLMNSDLLEKYFFYGHPLYSLWMQLKNIFRQNSLSGSQRNINSHYDVGNEFYNLWLDKSMTYSCALFEGDETRTLEEAQEAKFARIIRKLEASAGQHILDIGCGWGGFAEYAARRGIKVTAITLALNQVEFARRRLKDARLDDLVKVEYCDYRNIKGQFDHIVSIGMFEHVGEQYWDSYFKILKQNLKPQGRALIQSILHQEAVSEKFRSNIGFMENYIFPGGALPSRSEFCQRAQKNGLTCQEAFEFGKDYTLTLRHWLHRFETNRENIHNLGHDEPFVRLWRLYLNSCIATFRTGRCSVVQALLTQRT